MTNNSSTEAQGHGPSHDLTPSNLSQEFHHLRAKLTSAPLPTSPVTTYVPPLLRILPGDTPETISLIHHLQSQPHPPVFSENPTREVHFPHARPLGLPGTTKCVGRPGRPQLWVNTDVPVVSVPRLANRYGTPWRSAAPARYGPEGMESAEMCGWLKGKRDEEEDGEGEGEMFREVDEMGVWDEVDIGRCGEKGGVDSPAPWTAKGEEVKGMYGGLGTEERDSQAPERGGSGKEGDDEEKCRGVLG